MSDTQAKPRFAILSSHFSGKVKFDYLRRIGLQPASVIGISPAMAEKASVSGYHDFANDCQEHGIELHLAERFDLKSEKDVAYFKEQAFDFILISGWQRLIPGEVISTAQYGTIGEHGSGEFLPRGRGRSPINWTMLRGCERFVLHIFNVDEGADSGDIIDYEILPIEQTDDIYSMYCKVGISAGKLFAKNFQRLMDGSFQPLPQADVEPTYLPKRGPDDDWIRWHSMGTGEIDRLVRAITKPYPGAKTKLGDHIITVWKGRPFNCSADEFAMPFGSIVQVLPEGELVVKTIDGLFMIETYDSPVKPEVGMTMGR